jgi:hypothetical protein
MKKDGNLLALWIVVSGVIGIMQDCNCTVAPSSVFVGSIQPCARC